MISLLTNKWALIGIAMAAAAIGLVWFYLDAKAAGAAAVVSAALGETVRRATIAQKAKSEVKENDQAAMDKDEFNRDSHFGGR